jgi:catechol 2,3-dioxygenase-like lactoylglutathione lyase family enzyme
MATVTPQPHQQIVASSGPAAGKLSRFNHIVLVCRDMEESVHFYRDILGLKVVGTSGGAAQADRDAADSAAFGQPVKRAFTRQYFFELGNGTDYFSLYEVPDSLDGREVPPLANWLWPGSKGLAPEKLMKLDHLSFNVDSIDDLMWFGEHLKTHGVEIYGPVVAVERWATSPSLVPCRIYFYDPSGNPLEISTQNIGMEYWDQLDPSVFLKDTDPVPALFKEATEE